MATNSKKKQGGSCPADGSKGIFQDLERGSGAKEKAKETEKENYIIFVRRTKKFVKVICPFAKNELLMKLKKTDENIAKAEKYADKKRVELLASSVHIKATNKDDDNLLDQVKRQRKIKGVIGFRVFCEILEPLFKEEMVTPRYGMFIMTFYGLPVFVWHDTFGAVFSAAQHLSGDKPRIPDFTGVTTMVRQPNWCD
jgi:hypothetical protein